MYWAIGKISSEIYESAETKSELFRKLNKSFPFQSLADGCYPEALRIEKNNNNNETLNNMNMNEVVSLMMNHLNNPAIAKFVENNVKGAKKSNKRIRDGVKILVTFPDGKKKEYESMGKASKSLGVTWETIKYYEKKGKEDKLGRKYKRIESNKR